MRQNLLIDDASKVWNGLRRFYIFVDKMQWLCTECWQNKCLAGNCLIANTSNSNMQQCYDLFSIFAYVVNLFKYTTLTKSQFCI